MLGGFCSGLIVAWILSFFGVNEIMIEIIQPLVKEIILTDAHYYLFFALIGLIGCAIKGN